MSSVESAGIGQNSVEGIVTAAQAAAERLPVAEFAESCERLDAATSRLTTAFEADGTGRGVQEVLTTAHEHGAKVMEALEVARDSLGRYVQDIAGQGTADETDCTIGGSTPGAGLELGPITPLIIEERRIGDTPLKAVLVEHIAENAGLIADAVRDCDVVLLESVGEVDAATQKECSTIYSFIISSRIDSELADEFFEGTKDGNFIIAFLSKLRGTDKQILLIDINRDDPKYHLVEEYRNKGVELVSRILNMTPVDRLREAAIACIDADYRQRVYRDDLLRRQLEHIVPQLKGMRPGAVTGMGHFRVLDSIAPDARPSAISLRDKVWAAAETWNKAEMQQAEKGAPDPQLIDRLILSMLVTAHTGRKKEAEPFAQQIPEDKVAAILDALDRVAALPNPQEEKQFLVGWYLNHLVENTPVNKPGVALPLDTV